MGAIGAFAPLVPGAGMAATAAPGVVLVQQDATLTTAQRTTGMPKSNDAGRQLSRATIKVEVTGLGSDTTYFPSSRVSLRDYGSADDTIRIGFGNQVGSTCSLNAWAGSANTNWGGKDFEISGGYNPDYFATPTKPWDCVVVVLRDNSTGSEIDALVGSLKNTYHQPRLTVAKPKLLGKSPKKLGLVQGVKTEIEVTVKNTGQAVAQNVVITGQGKGGKTKVKVKKTKTDNIEPGRSATVKVPVTLKSKKAKKLVLRVRGQGVETKRVIKLKRVKAPKRPVTGQYRSKDGSVTFRIEKGRVVNFRVRALTRCGIAPNPYQYTWNTYDFPRTKVPRNGIVQKGAKGKNWGAGLRMRVTGKKVTRGLFNYFGPAFCSVASSFTAKRVGK